MTRISSVTISAGALLQSAVRTASMTSGEVVKIFSVAPVRAVDRLIPPTPVFPDSATKTSAAASQRLASLKSEYLHCLARISRNIEPLCEVIRRLLEFGVPKERLFAWAEVAGYSESHIRNLINRLLRESGCRARKPGAGRRTSEQSLKIMAFAIESCGFEDAGKHLLAAHHAWRVRMAAPRPQVQAA